MKKINLILIIIAISFTNIYSNSFKATISIDTNKVKKDIVTNKLFGGFTEFLLDYINGPNGIWAQEFMDRGFDSENSTYSTSPHWRTLISNTNTYEVYLKGQGFNENGRFYQFVKNYENKGITGIYQFITYDDTTNLDVYAYFRTEDTNTQAYIKILDENLNELYKQEIKNLNNNWNKKSFSIKAINGYSKVAVFFGIEGKGELSIDEASAMPSNNVKGIRKEYFDLFKNWNMGTLRWPGGSFADFSTTKWYYSIGDIDKRKSPLYGDRAYRQRMDFGLHEYMWLCDTLKIEPYLTINYYTGTAKEAEEWVRYCNYDTTDYYGKMRYINGSLKPFNVKYWEVGNEQWYYGINYAYGYVKFYDTLVKADPNIKFILATDIWPGKPYFDSVMSVIDKKGHIFGYHPILGSFPKQSDYTQDEWFTNTVSLPVNFEFIIEDLNEWIIERDLDKQYFQGSTEWGLGYVDFPELLYDTVDRSSTLEAGFFYAGKLLSYIRFAEVMHMSNVTIGYGFIRRGFNSINGKRAIVGVPSYQMYAMISRHFGPDLVHFDLQCPTYSLREIKGFWGAYGQKWMDVAVTKNKDTIFVAVINKNPNDSAITNLLINNSYIPDSIMVHQYTSNHYLDANTFDEPNTILPKSYKSAYNGSFNFPKHSLTILAIPIKDIITPNDSNNLSNAVNVFPNPANKILNVDFNDELFNFNELLVFDIEGKEYIPKYKLLNTNKIEINISELKTGKYYIKFTGSKKQVTKEFIVMP